MTPDYYFHVADPQIIGQPGANIVLRFQTIEKSESGYQRSGKYIHVEMVPTFAMQILAMLQVAQKTLGLPNQPQPETIVVPPGKDRH